jgi:hypothetical protein
MPFSGSHFVFSVSSSSGVHVTNDKAVTAADRFSVKVSRADCAAEIMKIHQQQIKDSKMLKTKRDE